MQTILIHEDNAGAVYLTRRGVTWALGPVTRDMFGRGVVDAQGWVEGEWEPNEHDGQSLADLAELVHIATWTPTGLVVERHDAGGLVAGAGGLSYLGITA